MELDHSCRIGSIISLSIKSEGVRTGDGFTVGLNFLNDLDSFFTQLIEELPPSKDKHMHLLECSEYFGGLHIFN